TRTRGFGERCGVIAIDPTLVGSDQVCEVFTKVTSRSVDQCVFCAGIWRSQRPLAITRQNQALRWVGREGFLLVDLPRPEVGLAIYPNPPLLGRRQCR